MRYLLEFIAPLVLERSNMVLYS